MHRLSAGKARWLSLFTSCPSAPEICCDVTLELAVYDTVAATGCVLLIILTVQLPF